MFQRPGGRPGLPNDSKRRSGPGTMRLTMSSAITNLMLGAGQIGKALMRHRVVGVDHPLPPQLVLPVGRSLPVLTLAGVDVEGGDHVALDQLGCGHLLVAGVAVIEHQQEGGGAIVFPTRDARSTRRRGNRGRCSAGLWRQRSSKAPRRTTAQQCTPAIDISIGIQRRLLHRKSMHCSRAGITWWARLSSSGPERRRPRRGDPKGTSVNWTWKMPSMVTSQACRDAW